ncbi:MAG TPA: hypothetical protein VMR99_02995, partial [Candidatus Paceibacterota bacterium]|nr:hypothetical protein [Candidatus Paceibacterota bacterium]
SDFGTSYIFSPPPICSGCLETELGFLSLEDGRYLPAVVTIAPFTSHTDVSVLVNVLDSESPQHSRVTHFGDRFDFVVRQQIVCNDRFALTLSPRGTLFTRGADGGRAGGTVAAQYAEGKNLEVVNFTLTKAIGGNASSDNPNTDYQGSFDYYRMVGRKGAAIFLGLQHEVSSGQQMVSTEEGLVIPFRNGQVEIAVEQLDLNSNPETQFQARAIVNWGKILHLKDK